MSVSRFVMSREELLTESVSSVCPSLPFPAQSSCLASERTHRHEWQSHGISHTRGCHLYPYPRLALTSVCPLERTSTCADGRPRLLQSRVSTLRQSDCVRRGRSTAAAAPRREARPPLCCPACQRSGRRAAARHAGAAHVCVGVWVVRVGLTSGDLAQDSSRASRA